ncbi:DUF3299 domain-containing protein [bacterium]|nr:DUF3299 domain-containing protein [bacterium]
MAVSQRNFLPLAAIIIGLILFAVFGFGRSEESQSPPPKSESAVVAGQRDEAEVDKVARLVAAESVETGEAEPPETSQTKPAPEKNPESERLNLSGQTADDSIKRSSDGKFNITFDNIKFDIPEGEPYSPEMLTEQVRSLDGQEVKLRGYIRPSFKQRDLKNFVFVRDDKECCFGPGAALFDCVVVKLAKDQKTDYTVRPVAVTGKFVLKEYTGPDGNVWAIYRMKDAAVTH